MATISSAVIGNQTWKIGDTVTLTVIADASGLVLGASGATVGDFAVEPSSFMEGLTSGMPATTEYTMTFEIVDGGMDFEASDDIDVSIWFDDGTGEAEATATIAQSNDAIDANSPDPSWTNEGF